MYLERKKDATKENEKEDAYVCVCSVSRPHSDKFIKSHRLSRIQAKGLNQRVYINVNISKSVRHATNYLSAVDISFPTIFKNRCSGLDLLETRNHCISLMKVDNSHHSSHGADRRKQSVQ